jgi:peptidoglycan/xylan/chitin deacetylase (PgdA/CDA1 family)
MQRNVNAKRSKALMNRKRDRRAVMNKHAIFRAGLSALSRTGIARLLAPQTRGLGAILMFHHVRPYHTKAFDPHRGLEIEPAFLDAVLTHLTASGYEIIPIDRLADRIRNPAGKPFALLTFDDGYRDTVEHALPVLRKHAAPFAVFVTTGFAEGAAPLWWRDLEDAVERGLPGAEASIASGSPEAVFEAIYGDLRPQAALQANIARIASKAGIDTLTRTRDLCLDWEALAALAADPLCTIGAHTLTHPLLGSLDAVEARREMAESKAILQAKLGRPVRHIAYPVGDPLAAGEREFLRAREVGFETGLTTRPGVIYPEHAAHLRALPRLSVNGLYQSIAEFDVLLSGAAFRLFNRGRKLNVT